MQLPFTKMQGAGNDFVVLDATRAPLALSPAQLRHLGDRRYGVGADQILLVEPAAPAEAAAGIAFRYRIFNGATGAEVEHCGNGARCFMRYVHDRGLSPQRRLQVQTLNRVLTLQLQDDGRVQVAMGLPVFDLQALPFDASGLQPVASAGQGSATDAWPRWCVEGAPGQPLALLSMGNPHAVLRVDDVDTAAVATLGPLIERHRRFAQGVNVGFMQVLARDAVRLRVHERDAGETLACGTGACAAVVAGIRLGWLARRVEVQARGGQLLIDWPQDDAPVLMSGPAETVYEGKITL
jgi:diaminopimelate epimerase